MEQNLEVLEDIESEVERIAGVDGDDKDYTQNIEALKDILTILEGLKLVQYVKTASVSSDRDVTLDMTGYTYRSSDVINVFINGAIGVIGTDWSIDDSGDTAVVTIAGSDAADIVITVLKWEG